MKENKKDNCGWVSLKIYSPSMVYISYDWLMFGTGTNVLILRDLLATISVIYSSNFSNCFLDNTLHCSLS
ncbi:hypothetical protein [Clostridium novyi]|uniref:hypothetical protein n=1 Tax=Clostridium novyi TaxID=1542 RepID=UPI0011474DF0|nr:hypothetical protein [Clostridium novyi]